ncbi:MATE family efflux transporter [Proteinivorax hydrogeniformans]|uniref:Probable multidrug resistance protein NorM n=1 Tax=Proteinivorax hydrogeniformans TaxID=1826727 RepID=A0AAU8HVZ8_9FIRM
MDVTKGSLKKAVILLALPVVLRMTLQMIVGVVDLAFIGQLDSTEATAGVGMANQLVMTTITVATAFTIGTTALIARYVGAKDPKKAGEVAQQSIVLTFGSGVILAILGSLFAEPIMRFLVERGAGDGNTAEVVRQGTIYLRIIVFSLPLMFVMMNTNAILQGAGDMKTPLYIMIFANAFNILFDWLLIFGIGIFPQLGVAGAAIATGGARSIAGITGAIVLTRNKHFKLKLFQIKFEKRIIRDILKIGIPSAGEQGVRSSGQLIFTMIAASLGPLAIASNAIVLKAMSFSFMPGFGFGLAATTLVGQNLGAGNYERAKQCGYLATKMAFIFMAGVGLFFFFGSDLIAMFFHRDESVRQVVSECIKILAISQPALAFVMVMAGGLRGAGDTRFVLFTTMAGTWGMRVIVAYIFANHYGIHGLWYAMVLDNLVRAVMMYYRFKGGKWQEIKVGDESIAKAG